METLSDDFYIPQERAVRQSMHIFKSKPLNAIKISWTVLFWNSWTEMAPEPTNFFLDFPNIFIRKIDFCLWCSEQTPKTTAWAKICILYFLATDVEYD